MPGVKDLDLSVIGSLQCFLILTCSMPVGRLLDAGYIRPILITGTVLLALGHFMLALAIRDSSNDPGKIGYIIATQGVVQSMGMACFFVTSSWGRPRKPRASDDVADSTL
jgi:MFS transporter, MCT family, solute carrier family 16 (monocarboxylic acid transporters), member 10